MFTNIERFSGFADTYDANRPQPPLIIADILRQIIRQERPDVVDIGCGTGLSTRIWAETANSVTGVEPNSDMRAQAQIATQALNIRYIAGTSTETGLPIECADIVTASQSFHWMDPQPTLKEIGRILRSGGVFATIDCDWPPTINPQAEDAYKAFTRRVHELEDKHQVNERISGWPKDGHLSNIRESNLFRFTKEIFVHSVEHGNAERLCGLALSFGGVATLVKLGLSEEEIGINQLHADAMQAIGDKPIPWFFSYRIRLGVK